MSKIKNHIEQWRKCKGITKAHLARQVGVNRSYISKLEREQVHPGAIVMMKLARYFGASVEAMFELDDKNPSQFPAASPSATGNLKLSDGNQQKHMKGKST